MKRIIFFAIFFVIIINLAFASKKTEVRVIYFHGPIRCHTCLQIENEAQMTIKSNFEKELKSGKLSFESIDYVSDTLNNYEKQYKLENQSLIIAKYENGKQTKWKKLEKIWNLTGNYDRMSRYISSEIKKFLD
jgi:hypothetical protein